MKITGEMIGAELKSLRAKNNLSAEDVAKITGSHYNTILKYEKDAKDCKISIFLQLLDLYKVDENIFFKSIREYNHINTE